MISAFAMWLSKGNTRATVSEFPGVIRKIFKTFEMSFLSPAIFGIVCVSVVKCVVHVFLSPCFERFDRTVTLIYH